MDNEESRKIVDEWKASNGYDDLLGAYSDAMSTISRINEWTLRYGEMLVPHAPWHDAYGDGMRAAKEQVSQLLRAKPWPRSPPKGE